MGPEVGPRLAAGGTIVMKPAEPDAPQCLRSASWPSKPASRRRHQQSSPLRPTAGAPGETPASTDSLSPAMYKTARSSCGPQHAEALRSSGRKAPTSSSPTPTSTPPSPGPSSACSSTRPVLLRRQPAVRGREVHGIRREGGDRARPASWRPVRPRHAAGRRSTRPSSTRS